ncbi:14943_t:CDS:2 [Cetraspora pellucida]|uniref:14943_t:CDS:1 n=1 Tax=Cetraspora pellucida TaxID=1433469 RepID=A0A9N9JJI2_9GLOM|nr:14943_t:CDS:2 [Cetraspora pellucida]
MSSSNLNQNSTSSEPNYGVLEMLIKKLDQLEILLLEQNKEIINLKKKVKKLKKKSVNDNEKQQKYDKELDELNNKEKSATEFIKVFPVIGGAVGGLLAVGIGYSSINERIKEIKTWIDSTKHYSLSGVFNCLRIDFLKLIEERKYIIKKLDDMESNVDNLLEQNTEYENIITDSMELYNAVLQNLEIDYEPSSLIDGLKRLKEYSKIVNYPE